MAWTDIPAPRLMKLVAIVFLTVAALLLFTWLTIKLWSLLILIGLALLFGTALLPYIDWVARFTKNRPGAVGLVMLSLLAGLILLGLLVLPPMIAQGRDIYNRTPQFQERVAKYADERGWESVRDQAREFSPSDYVSSDRLVKTGQGLIGFLVAFFTMFFITLYFVLDLSRIARFLYFSTPVRWHKHFDALFPPLKDVVGAYIRGQAITSVAIGAFTFVLLTVLGVPNALALTGIAMVADLVPIVGVFVLLGVTVLSALSVSTTAAAIVFVLMMIYQQFEDRILVPRIYGGSLKLPSVVVVVALLAGTELLGILGALVALPIAAAIRVVVEYGARARRESVVAAAAAISAQTISNAFAPSGGDASPGEARARS